MFSPGAELGVLLDLDSAVAAEGYYLCAGRSSLSGIPCLSYVQGPLLSAACNSSLSVFSGRPWPHA